VTSNARRPLVAGNGKLPNTREAARTRARPVVRALEHEQEVEVVLAPVFTALAAVREALAGSRLGLGAQTCYFEAQGAFTGEVSAELLADAGCSHVIVGHSERRALFGETDEVVRRKLEAALSAGLVPIVCVGETLEQRESGATEAVVLGQLDAALRGLEGTERVVLAYEPVWAIGTGRNALPADAQVVHARLRAKLGELHGPVLADGARILYGGSVKPGNAASLLAEPDIDGALVGGASLDPEAFVAIVAAARAEARQTPKR
jgi:triosephosphate isomerase